MKQFDIIIIGAGPAGMSAAMAASKRNHKVLLLDRADKVGKKILVTGNGKCNLTNENQHPSNYRSDQPKRVKEIFERFSYDKTHEFFIEMGILTRSKNGYIYPYNEQAASVRESFETCLNAFSQLTIQTSTYVNEIEPTKKGYLIHTDQGKYMGRSVILCNGGYAGSKVGCDGSGYKMAKRLGHKIVRTFPALTPLKSSAPFLKKASGVRNQAKIILYVDGIALAQEQGELQWTDYGISGVAIFQLSRYAIEALEVGKKVSLGLDFMPEWSMEECRNLLFSYKKNCPYKNMEEFLAGFMPAKLIPILLREAKIDPSQRVNELSDQHMDHLCHVLKEFNLRINGYMGFEKAQVTKGGVSLDELDTSLQSLHHPGLFFAGEVTDVDGACGGYNLQWAFSSGNVAGNAAADYVIKHRMS